MRVSMDDVDRLLQEGKKVTEIAKIINVPKSYVYIIAELLRGNSRYTAVLELLRSGASEHEVAEKTGYDVDTVAYLGRAFARFGLVPWRTRLCVHVPEDMLIDKLAGSGCNDIECLSTKLRLTKRRVKALLRRLARSLGWESSAVKVSTVRALIKLNQLIKASEEEVRSRCFSNISSVSSYYRKKLVKYMVARGYKVATVPPWSPFMKTKRKIVVLYREGCEDAVADHIIKHMALGGSVNKRVLASLRYWLKARVPDIEPKLADAIIRRLKHTNMCC